MKIDVKFSGPYGPAEWPEGWPVPGVGDIVYGYYGHAFKVSYLEWYPEAERPYVRVRTLALGVI